MKRKRLYLLLIGLLLISIFSINVFAEEEDPESDLGIVPPANYGTPYSLDSYFYDNYILLPYLESNGTQYIDTGIYMSSDMDISATFGIRDINSTGSYVYGADAYGLAYSYPDDSHLSLNFMGSWGNWNKILDIYSMYNSSVVDKTWYVNMEEVASYSNSRTCDRTLYIFGQHGQNELLGVARIRLYNLYIYDNSLSDPNDQESDPVGYIRYYYPARSKSGNVNGLYDAVTKTFVSSGSSSPFSNPDGNATEMSLTAGITQTLFAGLTWIGQILAFAKSNTVILIFLAIGLAGVMFRWARKVVHF